MTDGSAPDAGITQHSLDLTWKRFTAQRAVPACVRDMDIKAVHNLILDDMVIQASGYVLGEQLPSHVETATGFARFEAPASWWQHFKHQHGHRWWLRLLVRRRPVRMAAEVRRVTLTATWENMAGYPWAEYTTLAPNGRLGDPVRLSWLTSSMEWVPE
jgi:hypothetical protein